MNFEALVRNFPVTDRKIWQMRSWAMKIRRSLTAQLGAPPDLLADDQRQRLERRTA